MFTVWATKTTQVNMYAFSIFCGTGTPEPGGATFSEMMQMIYMMKSLNIDGLDVVELSPHYDTSKVSSITAAKVIRELLIMLTNKK